MLKTCPEQSQLHTPPIYDPPPITPRASTPLDPLETRGYIGADDPKTNRTAGLIEACDKAEWWEPLSETFRHAGWRERRFDVLCALRRTNAASGRLHAFCNCGRECYVLRSLADPNKYRLAASCCHDRFCLPCGTVRSRIVAANVVGYLAGEVCRFVTLTLRVSDLPLGDQLDRLYAAFKTLRKSPFWKNTQRGGVAFLELKRNKAGTHWHPHFHVLVQGKYIKAGELSRLWKDITKDSHVVDIRIVKDANVAVNYVAKYASKPMDSTIFRDPAALDDAVVALAGRRMIVPFGTWKSLKSTYHPTTDAWERLDTFDVMLIRAAQGDHEALTAIYQVCGARALWFLATTRVTLPALRAPPTAAESCPFAQLTLIPCW